MYIHTTYIYTYIHIYIYTCTHTYTHTYIHSTYTPLTPLTTATPSPFTGEMHHFRANDERKDEVGEGLSPIQVTLDQAAHLMDAVGFGKGDWESIRDSLATKYRDGGYPDMATFIETSTSSEESVLQ